MMNQPSSAIRVRFAPSPTGHLHIGGLRTALFNQLFAHHSGGTFLLRIEDTDRERSLPEYTESILQALHWCNILYDEPLIIQSDRLVVHQQVIQKLIEQDKAYRCYCEAKDTASTEEGVFNKYDGHCWINRHQKQNPDKPFAVRFHIPDSCESIVFEDLIRGRIEIQRDQLDDFVIARSGGFPMYNFVVVVDDAFMNITHVIRGEEHISNTPKQILLYEACNYKIPQFAHLPMILGSDGSKLSKRDAATSVLDYRKNGYLPEALINYLARLGWAHGDQEVFSKEELIKLFTIEAVGKKGAIFNQTKLDWLNSTYLKTTNGLRILQIIISDIDASFYSKTADWNDDQRMQLIGLYKIREKTIADIVHKIIALYKVPISYDQVAIQQWITADTTRHLEVLIHMFEQASDWVSTTLSAMVKQWCQEYNVPFVTIAQALRIAITGTSAAPGIFELIAIIGKNESCDRIKKLYNFLP